MTSTHILPVMPAIRIFVLREAAAKAFYFTVVASVFVFISILIIGVHP
jgi:hypothetical protein